MKMIDSFDKWVKKLALGTVQFGLNYGISNEAGQIDPGEVFEILKYSDHIGIATLDTAAAYGESEDVLGQYLVDSKDSFDIVSKFSAGKNGVSLRNALQQTLRKLKRPIIYGYLAHSFADFQKSEIRDAFVQAKSEGFINKIGVSVYYPSEIDWLLNENIEFDLVQLPFSVFDQRFLEYLKILKERNIEIHTRSVFLQGLFFMDPKSLPEYFSCITDTLIKLRHLANSNGIPLSSLLLNYALSQPFIDKVVFGVTSLNELKQNLDAFTYYKQSSLFFNELEAMDIDEESIILPFNWG